MIYLGSSGEKIWLRGHMSKLWDRPMFKDYLLVKEPIKKTREGMIKQKGESGESGITETTEERISRRENDKHYVIFLRGKVGGGLENGHLVCICGDQS